MDGGYAEYVLARTDFVFPLPRGLDDVHVAPLLCAGIIGFRSPRVAGIEDVYKRQEALYSVRLWAFNRRHYRQHGRRV